MSPRFAQPGLRGPQSPFRPTPTEIGGARAGGAPLPAPQVAAVGASVAGTATQATSVNLVATVNTEGLSGEWWFVYGPSPDFGASSSVSQISNGSAFVPQLTNLVIEPDFSHVTSGQQPKAWGSGLEGPIGGPINYAPNPSFEYDTVGAAPAGYTTSYSLTPTTYQVSTSWRGTPHGTKSLQVNTGSMIGTQQSEAFVNGPVSIPTQSYSGWSVSPGDEYYVQADWYLSSFTNTPYAYLEIWYYDGTGTYIAGSARNTANIAQSVGAHLAEGLVVTAPTGASYMGVSITWGPSNSAGQATFFVDGVMVTKSAAAVSYFDGDSFGYAWSGTPGNSVSEQSASTTSVQNNGYSDNWLQVSPPIMYAGSPLGTGGVSIPLGHLIQGQTVTANVLVESGSWGTSTNLIRDPSFEHDATGGAPAGDTWTAATGTSTFTVSTAQSYAGSKSLYTAGTVTQGTYSEVGAYGTSSAIPVTPGETYTLSAYCYPVSVMTGALPTIYIRWTDDNGAQISEPSRQGTATLNAWQQISLTATAPSNAVHAVPIMLVSGGSTGGTYSGYFDAVQFTQTSGAVSYFDGDTPGYRWTAATGDSASTSTAISQTISVELEDNSLGNGPVYETASFSTYESRQWVTVTWTPTADSQNARLYVTTPTASQDTTFYLRQSIVVNGAAVPAWFSGDTPGYAWNGEPGYSQSIPNPAYDYGPDYPQTVTLTLTGLTQNAEYWYAVACRTAGGYALSAPLTFYYSPPVAPPTVPQVGSQSLVSSVTVPHFSWPFTIRYGTPRSVVNGSVTSTDGAVVVQQDTDGDVTSCVQAIANCTIGEFPQAPSFGIPDMTFQQAPLDIQALTASILRWEPRANQDAISDLVQDGTYGTWRVDLSVNGTSAPATNNN